MHVLVLVTSLALGWYVHVESEDYLMAEIVGAGSVVSPGSQAEPDQKNRVEVLIVAQRVDPRVN